MLYPEDDPSHGHVERCLMPGDHLGHTSLGGGGGKGGKEALGEKGEEHTFFTLAPAQSSQ